MAKITFVQDELRDRIGVMCLSAALKKKGHAADVCCNMAENDLVKAVLATKPDIVGLSTSTVEHKFALLFAEEFKRQAPGTPIVMGGPHATFFPEVLEHPAIDLICRGEGDLALVELLDRIGKRIPYHDLENFHVKRDGKIVKNQLRSLIEDLDSLPFPDRTIYYDRYPQLAANPTKTFMAMRGCPFLCSYCFNHAMMNLYRGKGRYLRFRSPENFVDEIRTVKERYGMKWAQLNDDTLNFRKDWLYAFLDLYRKTIGLGFICNVRVDYLEEEMVRRLKEAGCDRVNFGIEHGNEAMRRALLKRAISDQEIIDAGRWFKKYRIRLFTTNITGFPGETIRQFFETVRLNRKVHAEWSGCFILQPFPGTEIYDYARERGYLSRAFSIDDLQHPHSNFFSHRRSGSSIRQPNIKRLTRFQKFFYYLVKYPWSTPLVYVLSYLPGNRFYDFMFVLPEYRRYIKYARDNHERWEYAKRLFKVL